MYTDSAHWNNSHIVFKDKTHPLFVLSCGTYRLFSRPRLPTYRPRGRIDFQLLYIASGQAHFIFDGEDRIIPAGNMVLYRPKEVQQYYYLGSDHTEVFWVHFTGNNVTNLLRAYGFPDHEHVIHTGTSLEYRRLYQQIIQELMLCKADYEEMAAAYLRMLFVLVHRLETSPITRRSSYLIDELDTAVRYFHEHYNEPISVEAYASSRGMSVSWFIRNFRDYTDSTPTQYLLSLRIRNAQNLLENTSYNIAEISGIVGYDNPLYFSRLFHKFCGISPREYRRQQLALSPADTADEAKKFPADP